MNGPVIVTHTPSGKVKTFDHPRKACAFLLELKEKKVKDADIKIDNQYGVSLSAYHPRIPLDAQELIERLETILGGNTVPEWHWIPKSRNHIYASGHTRYTSQSLRTRGIAISSAGLNPRDYLGVVVHEFTHAVVGHDDSHNRNFYKTFFAFMMQPGILRDTISREGKHSTVQDIRKWTLAREFRYKKSSRYWYAEMYQVQHILDEYRRPEPIAAAKLTKAQKAELAAQRMFED